MQYAKILAALDLEIDCLQRARDLLVNSMFPGEKSLKQINSASKKRIRKTKPEVELPLQPEQAPPQIQKVPYKERARFRRRKSSPTAALMASTALSSHVSAAPVVVSADEAQKARVRETEQTRSAPQIPEIDNRNGERSLDSLIRAFHRGHIPAGLEI